MGGSNTIYKKYIPPFNPPTNPQDNNYPPTNTPPTSAPFSTKCKKVTTKS